MKLPHLLSLTVFTLAVPIANAKLPPPPPEEAARRAAEHAQQEERLAEQKAALERAQDRVAERYRGEQVARPRGGVDPADLPHNTKEAPGTAGPEGGGEQSAEAHSAPAK